MKYVIVQAATEPVKIGFWRLIENVNDSVYKEHNLDASLPWPKENSAEYDVDNILNKLILRESESNIEVRTYRGISLCRLCRERVGCQEYTYIDNEYSFVWPSSLKHYIKVHSISLPEEFITFLLR